MLSCAHFPLPNVVMKDVIMYRRFVYALLSALFSFFWHATQLEEVRKRARIHARVLGPILRSITQMRKYGLLRKL